MDSFSLDRIMYLFHDLILHLQKIKFVTFFSGKKMLRFFVLELRGNYFLQYLWSFSSPQAFDYVASGTILCRKHLQVSSESCIFFSLLMVIRQLNSVSLLTVYKSLALASGFLGPKLKATNLFQIPPLIFALLGKKRVYRFSKSTFPWPTLG